MSQQLRITINDKPLDVPEGLTVLDVCRQQGLEIPTMCFMKGYERFTSCMVCVVKNLDNGRLIPACSAPVEDGMRIVTEDPDVQEARRVALELLLSDHVGDCEAPCMRACPAHMDIPLMIRQIAAGKTNDAVQTMMRDIALPGVLGRICPAPCEKACRRGRHDQPISICLLKCFAADTGSDGALMGSEQVEQSGFRVAIVGAGPAGLAAAFYLRRRGHQCALFDRGDRPGGGLLAVDREQLPEKVLRRDVDRILKQGVAFKPRQVLGENLRLGELEAHYDAVVVTVGEQEEGQVRGWGLEWDNRGIDADRRTHLTGREGLFAGGAACGRGKRLAVRAVGDGKEIAEAVDQYLRKKEITGEYRRFNCTIGAVGTDEMSEFLKQADSGPRVEPDAGSIGGFSADEAKQEARRCLHCDCRKPNSCLLREYADRYGARQHRYKGKERKTVRLDLRHDRVVFEQEKCIKCGRCVRISEQSVERLGLTFVGRGFDIRIGVPFDESLANGLTETAERCVAACPTGALAWRQGEDQKIAREVEPESGEGETA